MKLIFCIVIMAIQKHIVESSIVRNICRFEARMLSLNRSISTERQSDLQRYADTRRQRIGYQYHRAQIRPRFKRQFMAPMPRQRQSESSEDPESIENRSMCPWRRVLDVNMTRIPHNMYKAECIHDAGNNMCDFSFPRLMDTMDEERARGYRAFLDYLSLETECAVVYDRKNVQVECCEDGIYRRESVWIDWPVACACARKKRRVIPWVN